MAKKKTEVIKEVKLMVVRPKKKALTKWNCKFNEGVFKQVEDYVNTIAYSGSNHLPKVESLALYIGVERKTLYNWAKANPKFKRCLKWIKELQYERLIDDGVYGGTKVNGALVKLILVSNHKLRDEIGVGLSGEVTTKFSDEQIKRIADRVLHRGRNDGDQSVKE